MTIERRIFSNEPHELISREQLAVGQTVDLGKKALMSGILGPESSEVFTHKVVVTSHEQVEEMVADSLDNGIHHIKTQNYINEDPPWGVDEKGNLTVIIWEPTVYGENGDGRVIGFPLES